MIICNPRSLAFALLDSGTARGICVGRWWRRPWWCNWRREWVRQAWGVPPLAAERRREPLEVAPAGAVGGGSPGSNNPAGNGSSWNGQPKQECRRPPRK